jgi:hypothetical protein
VRIAGNAGLADFEIVRCFDLVAVHFPNGERTTIRLSQNIAHLLRSGQHSARLRIPIKTATTLLN